MKKKIDTASFRSESNDHSSRRRGRTPSAQAKAEAFPRDEFRFSNAVALALTNAGIELPDGVHPHDPLASLNYDDECAVKLEAIRSFWRAERLPAALLKGLIRSPLPRGYRTSSKRRIFIASGGRMKMTMGYGSDHSETVVSPLEPPMHGEIYAFLRKVLARETYAPLTRNLNYVVLRGSMNACSLILNFFHMDASVMRKVKLLAGLLRKEEPRVLSLESLVDETRSEYYLDSRFDRRTLRRHFGPELLDATVGGLKYFYPPVSFSQVNESILDVFASEIEKLLAPTPGSTVYDLYCGYGLLGIRMAQHAKRVLGVDFNESAIQAAIGNASHLVPGRDVRFQTASISASWLENLPPPDGKELFLLDPPRGGTSPGVIRAVADRKPARVVHVFCSVDQQKRELRIWRGCGYHPTAVRLFDMFPGSANLETAILLERREIRRSEPDSARDSRSEIPRIRNAYKDGASRSGKSVRSGFSTSRRQEEESFSASRRMEAASRFKKPRFNADRGTAGTRGFRSEATEAGAKPKRFRFDSAGERKTVARDDETHFASHAEKREKPVRKRMNEDAQSGKRSRPGRGDEERPRRNLEGRGDAPSRRSSSRRSSSRGRGYGGNKGFGGTRRKKD